MTTPTWYQVGDRFILPEESVDGTITDVVYHSITGKACALIVAMDDGQWAAVDISKLVERVLH